MRHYMSRFTVLCCVWRDPSQTRGLEPGHVPSNYASLEIPLCIAFRLLISRAFFFTLYGACIILFPTVQY